MTYPKLHTIIIKNFIRGIIITLLYNVIIIMIIPITSDVEDAMHG